MNCCSLVGFFTPCDGGNLSDESIALVITRLWFSSLHLVLHCVPEQNISLDVVPVPARIVI